MTRQDAPAAARLHAAALRGLLAELGVGVMIPFYGAAVTLSDTVAVAADDDGRVLGFACGTTDAAGYYRKVFRSSPFAIGGRVALAVLRRPRLIGHLVSSGEASGAELLFLAVADEARRRGVGQALVDAFEAGLKARGATSYHLSVQADNEGAVGFYEQLGLTREATFEEFGLVRCRYRRELPS